MKNIVFDFLCSFYLKNYIKSKIIILLSKISSDKINYKKMSNIYIKKFERDV
jgi:hypothetical protein